MRTAAIATLGLMLATGSAWAQSSSDYRDRDDDRSSSTYGSQSYSSDRSSSGSWNDDHHYGKRDHHYGKSRHARGATFYMKHGDKEFRVDCGDDDSTRECVDAAMMMFRQVQDAASRMSTSTTTYPSTTGSSTTGSSTSTTPSTSGSTAPTPGGAATGR